MKKLSIVGLKRELSFRLGIWNTNDKYNLTNGHYLIELDRYSMVKQEVINLMEILPENKMFIGDFELRNTPTVDFLSSNQKTEKAALVKRDNAYVTVFDNEHQYIVVRTGTEKVYLLKKYVDFITSFYGEYNLLYSLDNRGMVIFYSNTVQKNVAVLMACNYNDKEPMEQLKILELVENAKQQK